MIVCAAIKIRLTSNENEVVITGLRHSDCFDTIKDLGLKPQEDYIILDDGFIDHHNHFLDRKAAYQHAKDIGQLPVNLIYLCGDILFSEDLY